MVNWRPGWQLELMYEPINGSLALIARGGVPDTYTENWQQISHRHTLLPLHLYRKPLDFFREVLARLQEIDMHECAEWFRVNGEHVADPHHEDGRYTGSIIPSVLDTALGKEVEPFQRHTFDSIGSLPSA